MGIEIRKSDTSPVHNIGKKAMGKAPEFKFNNCPTRCDLFSLLYICRQLYMFRVLTPIISSSYNCNYSFWYWL